MRSMHTRRRFIEIVPIGGITALVACSPSPSPKPAPATAAPPSAALPTTQPPTTPSPSAPPPNAAAAPAGASADAPMLDEKDPQAVALGYVQDTARADKAKFSAYVAGSQCSGCSLYQGKAGEAAGGCTLFPGKKVTAQGWCSAWVKKA